MLRLLYFYNFFLFYFSSSKFFFILFLIIKYLSLVVPLLLAVAMLTLTERKLLAAIQRRLGPNVVGFLGIGQALADGGKLLLKEPIVPLSSYFFTFLLMPLIFLFVCFGSWLFIPFSLNEITVINHSGLLFIFGLSSISVYALMFSGWSSNSLYALLGGLRSAAQMIAYEVVIGFVLVNIIILVGSLNLNNICLAQQHVYFIIPLFPVFFFFLISSLAELNRAPFDLPEAEGELVAGYNVEYSSFSFALFFLAEYANIILMSIICVILFLGGWLPLNFLEKILIFNNAIYFSFLLKICFLLFIFIGIRALLPRYRYDQLMFLGWKVLLPLTLVWLILTIEILFFFRWLPISF